MPRLKKVAHVKEKHLYQCPHCNKVVSDASALECHIETHNDEYPYSCPVCVYKCKVKKYLSRHIKKVHTQANGPHCPVCDKVFHFNSSLKNHMRVHTGEKPYKCPVCNKAFSSSYCLSMHKMIHTDEKPYHCNFCDYACRDSSTLRRHEERHMGTMKSYPCMKCKKIFKTNALLKFHMDEVHFGIDTRRLPCQQCGKAFKTRSALNVHIVSRDNVVCHNCWVAVSASLVPQQELEGGGHQNSCIHCGRSVRRIRSHSLRTDTDRESLIRNVIMEWTQPQMKSVHLKVHQTECDICGRSFSKTNILNHFKSHIDIRPYKCRVCPKKFKDQSSLKKHTLIHYPEYQHECSLCGTKFPRKNRLKKHMRQHAADGNYICDYCGVSFAKKPCLINHIRQKHAPNCDRFICDLCDSVDYSRRAITLHLQYGHGTEYDRKCKICASVSETSIDLKEHYLKLHNIRYVVMKSDEKIVIKDEPLEVCAEFDYNYDIQKIEVDDQRIPDPEYVDSRTTQPYPERVSEEDLSTTTVEVDIVRPQSEFDKFFAEQVMKKPTRKEIAINVDPEHLDTETNVAYSEKVLEEDISRSLNECEKKEAPENSFSDFFKKQFMKKPRRKDLPKNKVNAADKRKLADAKKTIEKMLNESRMRRESEMLEKMRRMYNKRIKIAYESAGKKDPTQIKYFKKTDNSPNNNNSENDNIIQEKDVTDDQNESNDNNANPRNGETEPRNEKIEQQNGEIKQQNEETKQQNEETNQQKEKTELQNDQIDDDDDAILNIPLSLRRNKRNTRKSKMITNHKDINQSDDEISDNDGSQKNGKIKFNGHECYICFKLFKTKKDLKAHCLEHFDVCNEKMLKKCPFCGYVTDLNIKRHMELVHKFNVNYAYGQIMEKQNKDGSKYVFEIDKNCELEIIPSISSLNRIACMKIDEKNRENKNIFFGKTKLVKKGNQWVVEKQPVNLTNEYLLPEFSEEEYQKVKFEGVTYLDRIKNLSVLAKKRGIKMLFPCEGCEKICQTMSALKLHSRKHEANPKKFRPKVWVNRHIEYKTKNRKRVRISNKTRNKLKEKAAAKKMVKKLPVKIIPKKIPPVRIDSSNRFASPQPVKNNHKCDKELIEFYKSNIKGGDIEFWQFLKIFNKMSRENVNDFKDLENRSDVHFGLHVNDKAETAIVDNESVNTDEEPKRTDKEPETARKKEPVLPKNSGKCKNNGRKTFTRAIMISKQEYMRRNEIKNQMRMKLQENKM